MVRLLVVEPTHSDLNLRFDVDVTYLQLIILSVVDNVTVDSKTLFDRLRESLGSNRPDLSKVLIEVECAYIYL
jgi:hypothetical protein